MVFLKNLSILNNQFLYFPFLSIQLLWSYTYAKKIENSVQSCNCRVKKKQHKPAKTSRSNFSVNCPFRKSCRLPDIFRVVKRHYHKASLAVVTLSVYKESEREFCAYGLKIRHTVIAHIYLSQSCDGVNKRVSAQRNL